MNRVNILGFFNMKILIIIALFAVTLGCFAEKWCGIYCDREKEPWGYHLTFSYIDQSDFELDFQNSSDREEITAEATGGSISGEIAYFVTDIFSVYSNLEYIYLEGLGAHTRYHYEIERGVNSSDYESKSILFQIGGVCAIQMMIIEAYIRGGFTGGFQFQNFKNYHIEEFKLDTVVGGFHLGMGINLFLIDIGIGLQWLYHLSPDFNALPESYKQYDTFKGVSVLQYGVTIRLRFDLMSRNSMSALISTF